MATQDWFSVFLTIWLFLMSNAKSESFSINFPDFKNANGMGFLGDARISKEGVLELTKKDKNGDPLPHSAGVAGLFAPVPIYDKKRSKVFNFTTEFTFIVRKGSGLHGDGMTFFLASPDIKFPNTKESEGGYLGVFNPKTAFDESKNKLVAIEFDSFTNEWDPVPQYPLTQSPHIGMDLKSLKSESSVEWQCDNEKIPDGTIGFASISYECNALVQQLNVLVTYPELGLPFTGASILQGIVDLPSLLPHEVTIGFSASTGDLVETHDILSWSFYSNF